MAAAAAAAHDPGQYMAGAGAYGDSATMQYDMAQYMDYSAYGATGDAAAWGEAAPGEGGPWGPGHMLGLCRWAGQAQQPEICVFPFTLQ